MNKLVESCTKFLANVTEADLIALYVEREGIFQPLSFFSVSGGVVFLPFSEEEDNFITSNVIRRWDYIVSSDSSLMEKEGLPLEGLERSLRVLMAFPFKLGADRALLLFGSSNLASFSEKHQGFVRDGIELLKRIFALNRRLEKSRIPAAENRFLTSTLKLFAELPPKDAFYEWCYISGLDLGVLFSARDDLLRPVVVYRTKGFSEELDIELGPRNPVRLAYERKQAYVYDEKAELVPGFVGYGVVVPSHGPKLKGVLLLGSSRSDFFSHDMVNMLESVLNVMLLSVSGEGERECHAIDAVEAENRIKILAGRAQREDRVLGLLLLIVKGMDKEYSDKGFWEVERRMREFMRKVELLNPAPELVARISDNAVLVARIFDDESEVDKYEELFNAFVADMKPFKDMLLEVLMYPHKGERIDTLLSQLAQKVVKSKRKKLF